MNSLQPILPYLALLVSFIVALTTWLHGRDQNAISRQSNTISADTAVSTKYEVLDQKQEQIAEWGFAAAEEANKRADRIAAEAKAQVTKLQTQLDALSKKLDEQTRAMENVRHEHENEIRQMRDQHIKELVQREQQIAALDLEVRNLRRRVEELEGKNE